MTEKSTYTGPWQVPWKRAKKDPSAPKVRKFMASSLSAIWLLLLPCTYFALSFASMSETYVGFFTVLPGTQDQNETREPRIEEYGHLTHLG